MEKIHGEAGRKINEATQLAYAELKLAGTELKQAGAAPRHPGARGQTGDQ